MSIQMTSLAHSQRVSYQGVPNYSDNSTRLSTPMRNYQIIPRNKQSHSKITNRSLGREKHIANPRAKAIGLARYFTRHRDPLVME